MLGLLLQITEVMYNPAGTNTGRQWIEVRNVSDSAIDLGAKDVRVNDAKGSHLIKAEEGSMVLLPGALAVIAENPDTFRADWPHYSGTLMKSAFSLTSAGSVQVARTDGTVLATANYDSSMGARNDGNSLQLSDGSFVAAVPTPGVYVKPHAQDAAQAKPSTAMAGSIKREVTNESYDPGTVAPSPSAKAEGGGALSRGPVTVAAAFQSKVIPLVSSVWFSSFLLLLAFSGFSLILLIRYA